jgi:hypothetical protein
MPGPEFGHCERPSDYLGRLPHNRDAENSNLFFAGRFRYQRFHERPTRILVSLRIDCPQRAIDRRGDLMGAQRLPFVFIVAALCPGVCLSKGSIAHGPVHH